MWKAFRKDAEEEDANKTRNYNRQCHIPEVHHGEIGQRIHDVQQVMRRHSPLRWCHFRGNDIQPFVHLQRNIEY